MDKIKNISQLIMSTFSIQSSYVKKEQYQVMHFDKANAYNPLYFKNDFLTLNTDFLNSPINFPRIRKNKFQEIYILLSVFNNHEFAGTLIIGPTVPAPLTSEQILALIKDQQSFHLVGPVQNYYQNLPVYSTKTLIYISVLLYYLLNNEIVPTELVQTDLLQASLDSTTETIDTPNPQSKIMPQHDRLFEKRILKIVRNGEIEKLNTNFFIKDEVEQTLYSRTSFLRSLKNHIITLVALISRTAIDGGLHSEVSMRLCDDYILKIEESQSRESLFNTCAEMLATFTHKVRESQELNYSMVVKQAIKFVYENLYQPFSHENIAENIGVNSQYLSRVFKKETQQSLSTFIQIAKIEEAKLLLGNPKITVSDVASYLNFSVQSYFTKVFKRHTQTTPQNYRERSL